MEVLKFYLDGGDQFYKDLVWTFRKVCFLYYCIIDVCNLYLMHVYTYI